MNLKDARALTEKIKDKAKNEYMNGPVPDPNYLNSYLVGWLSSALTYVISQSNLTDDDLKHFYVTDIKTGAKDI